MRLTNVVFTSFFLLSVALKTYTQEMELVDVLTPHGRLNYQEDEHYYNTSNLYGDNVAVHTLFRDSAGGKDKNSLSIINITNGIEIEYDMFDMANPVALEKKLAIHLMSNKTVAIGVKNEVLIFTDKTTTSFIRDFFNYPRSKPSLTEKMRLSCGAPIIIIDSCDSHLVVVSSQGDIHTWKKCGLEIDQTSLKTLQVQEDFFSSIVNVQEKIVCLGLQNGKVFLVDITNLDNNKTIVLNELINKRINFISSEEDKVLFCALCECHGKDCCQEAATNNTCWIEDLPRQCNCYESPTPSSARENHSSNKYITMSACLLKKVFNTSESTLPLNAPKEYYYKYQASGGCSPFCTRPQGFYCAQEIKPFGDGEVICSTECAASRGHPHNPNALIQCIDSVGNIKDLYICSRNWGQALIVGQVLFILVINKGSKKISVSKTSFFSQLSIEFTRFIASRSYYSVLSALMKVVTFSLASLLLFFVMKNYSKISEMMELCQ